MKWTQSSTARRTLREYPWIHLVLLELSLVRAQVIWENKDSEQKDKNRPQTNPPFSNNQTHVQFCSLWLFVYWKSFSPWNKNPPPPRKKGKKPWKTGRLCADMFTFCSVGVNPHLGTLPVIAAQKLRKKWDVFPSAFCYSFASCWNVTRAWLHKV